MLTGQRFHILSLLATVVAVQLLTLALGKGFYLTQLTMTAYYSLIIIGLCLLMGYAGQISLGHAGIFAIGGYASGRSAQPGSKQNYCMPEKEYVE